VRFPQRPSVGTIHRRLFERRQERAADMRAALRRASAPPVTQERRECPVCHQQIQTFSDRKTLQAHDDKPVDGALCDGSWKEAKEI
jgi:hypothetical protein